MAETILIILAIQYYLFCASLLICLNIDNLLGVSTKKTDKYSSNSIVMCSFCNSLYCRNTIGSILLKRIIRLKTLSKCNIPQRERGFSKRLFNDQR